MSAQIFFITHGVNSHMFHCRNISVFARPCRNVTDVLLSVRLVTFLNCETHLAPTILGEALCTCETSTNKNQHLLRTFTEGPGFCRCVLSLALSHQGCSFWEKQDRGPAPDQPGWLDTPPPAVLHQDVKSHLVLWEPCQICQMLNANWSVKGLV